MPWVAQSAMLPCCSLLSPVVHLGFLCTNVGPQGLLLVTLPAPFIPHSASLGPATAMQVLSARLPVSTPPTGLDECLFFIYLVLDFLAVGFSVSSGCVRRRSVSTYATILFLSLIAMFLLFLEYKNSTFLFLKICQTV